MMGWIYACAGMTDDGVDSRLRGNDGVFDRALDGKKSARMFELMSIFFQLAPFMQLYCQPEKQREITFIFQ